MLNGITSPQIMPPEMFKEALEYYFMKYDINTLKLTNMNIENAANFYNNDKKVFLLLKKKI